VTTDQITTVQIWLETKFGMLGRLTNLCEGSGIGGRIKKTEDLVWC